jgi:ProP effector
MMTVEEYRTGIKTLNDIIQRWPNAFAASRRKMRPLAVGIDKVIIAAAPELDATAVKLALGCYTSNSCYLRVLKTGAARVGLDGEPQDVVTENAATFAIVRLNGVLQRQRAKYLASVKAKREQAAPAPTAPPEPEHVVNNNMLTSPETVAVGPKRLGLADLKAAAKARREAAA